MRTTFQTEISGFGNNAGIEVPSANLAELGTSRRPPVLVTVGDYTYRSTVGVMGGRSLISLPKAHREAAGLQAGDQVTVTLVLEDGPRPVDVPPALQTALESAGLAAAWDALAYSKRKEHARSVAEAKAHDTRVRRIEKVLAALS